MTTGNITITNGSTGYSTAIAGYSSYSGLTVTGSLPNSNTVWNTATSPYYVDSTVNSSTGIKINKGNLELEDKDADIKLGDVSLMKFMRDINQRLNIMQPNIKLEKEWEELRELGDQYRRLEKELIEKAKVWDILKTT